MIPAARKRGRPVTGNAVSAADRNKKYRAIAALKRAIFRASVRGVDVRAVVEGYYRPVDRGDGKSAGGTYDQVGRY